MLKSLSTITLEMTAISTAPAAERTASRSRPAIAVPPTRIAAIASIVSELSDWIVAWP